MTEVVTNGAAFLQPYLQPNRAQAFGVSNPDSPQFALQIAAELSRENASLAATEVPSTTADRSNLQNDLASNADPQPNSPQPKAANTQPQDAPATPTGPSKARVDIPPIQLAEAPSLGAPATPASSAPVATPAAPAAAPASTLVSTSDTSTPATPAPSSDDAPKAVATDGPLGPAEALNSLTLENLSQNIIGVAFAPTQVAQTGGEDVAAAQRQKNFIFAQRRIFADAVQATGKFAAQETKHVEAVSTAHFAVQAAQPAATTFAAGKFAATETSQKLVDKASGDQKSGLVENGDVRLYDKVSQSDTQNSSSQDGSEQGRRESLYQRAQAIAVALGNKADNPAVQRLNAELASYKAAIKAAGGNPNAVHPPPSVVVTA